MSITWGRISILIITLLFMLGIVVYTMVPAQGAPCKEGSSPSASLYNEGAGNCAEGDTSTANPEPPDGGQEQDPAGPLRK